MSFDNDSGQAGDAGASDNPIYLNRPGLDSRVTDSRIQYRSRGEARVADALDLYGILHFYEQPTLIFDRGRYRVWRPDFTLPQYNGLVIEYAGMMDVPDYAKGIEHKRQAFAANSVPALFVYPQDLGHEGWGRALVERIEQAAYQDRQEMNRGLRYPQKYS